MFTKLGFGKIDWAGIKRVLVHSFIVGLAYLATQGEGFVLNHDWGSYAMLVMAGNTIVFTFLEKLFGTYNVVLTVPSKE